MPKVRFRGTVSGPTLDMSGDQGWALVMRGDGNDQDFVFGRPVDVAEWKTPHENAAGLLVRGSAAEWMTGHQIDRYLNCSLKAIARSCARLGVVGDFLSKSSRNALARCRAWTTS